ncbi:MAG: DegQ family serine endoprotease [Alphaproteobacteria bacterium]
MDFSKGQPVRAALFRLVGLLLVTAAALLPAAASAKVPESRAEITLSFAPLVKQVAPAVVNIYTRKVVQEVQRSPLFDDPFFRQFFGRQFGVGPKRRRQVNSLGSGVILTADGLIVTNHHVIDGADQITVALTDRREFPAELVLDDEHTDLAVLRIDAAGEELPFLDLRDSDELQVGDLVLAIGNPFNVGQTVTSGIVSALARTGVGISDYQFFVQTDAAINPGNSGGALVGIDGRLVGVNTAIFSRSGGSHGIGFAIPANMVRVVLQSAREGLSYVARPWLGVETQPVTAEIAEGLGLPVPLGAMVSATYPGGPADRAGIRPGDIVEAVDGQDIEDPSALGYRLGTRLVGGEAQVRLWRQGKVVVASVPMRRAPEEPPRDEREIDGRNPLAGAVVANLSPALAEEMRLNPMQRGVIVTRLRRGSVAYRNRLRPGDRVLKVNGEAIATVGQLVDVVEAGGDGWSMSIQRGDQVLNLVIRG